MKTPPAEACCYSPKLPKATFLMKILIINFKFSALLHVHRLSDPICLFLITTPVLCCQGYKCLLFPITYSGVSSVGAQVKFYRFLALKGLLWISNSSLWAVLTPVVETVSTFPSKSTSVIGCLGCRRVGVLFLFIFSPVLHLCWQLI